MNAHVNAASGASLDETVYNKLDALDAVDHIKIAKLDYGTPIFDESGLDITNQECVRLNAALGLGGLETKTADETRHRVFWQWIGSVRRLSDISRSVVGVSKERRHAPEHDELHFEPARPRSMSAATAPKAEPTPVPPPARATAILNGPVSTMEVTQHSPVALSSDSQLERTANLIRKLRHMTRLDILVEVANGRDNIAIGALFKMSVPSVANAISKMYQLFQVPKKNGNKRYGSEERKHLGAATRLAYPERFRASPTTELEPTTAPTGVAEAEPVALQDIASAAPVETIEPVVEPIEDVSGPEATPVEDEPISATEPEVPVEPEPVVAQTADPEPIVIEKAPVPISLEKTEGDGKAIEPHAIDLHVGQQIRRRRRLLGISQEKLADNLGLTFQQVQKYERGANRVSASKLYEIGRSLQTSIQYFFDGLPGYDTISADDVLARTDEFVSKRVARARKHFQAGLTMLNEIPVPEDEDSDEAS